MRIMKVKFILILCVIVAVLLSIHTTTYATEFKSNEYSEKYKEWLKLSDEEKEKTIPPLKFNVNVPKPKNTMAKLKSLLKSGNTSIPERYDLREHIDINVKDQKSTDSCWAFSATTNLETNLALQGEIYDFSERHIEYDTADNFIDGKNPYGLSRTVGGGGHLINAFTYYARGSGPILEEDMPFEDNSKLLNLYELPKNQAVKKVGEMVYFPTIYKDKDQEGNIIYTDANNEIISSEDLKIARDTLKEYIMKNGSVTACVSNPSNIWRGTSYSEANCSDNYWGNWAFTDHAVTIIGWDDTYDKNNFINVPSENGAYIVLNSWGEEWGDNGVYYVSYEDKLIESVITGQYKVENIEYDKIYQHDIGNITKCLDARYAANVFTAEDNEKITEIMIGTTLNGPCDIYVNNTSDSLAMESLTKVASNVNIHGGYNSIKLENAIQLTKGNKFAIVVHCLDDVVGVGIEGDDEGENYVVSNPGESYGSYDGTEWIDIYDEGYMMNFSIKAFTQKDNETLNIGKVDGIAYQNVGGNFAFPISSSNLECGEIVDVEIYKDGNNVTELFEIKGTIIRGNGTYIKIKCPENIIGGEYSVKAKLHELESNEETFYVEGNIEDFIKIQCKDELLYEILSSSVKGYRDDSKLSIYTTQEEIDKVTEMPSFRYAGITDISGLEYFHNIRSLNLNGNDIEDLSPIGNLTKLEELYVMATKATDFSFINNLKELRILAVGYNKISSLDFLYGLNKIEALDITDISEDRVDLSLVFDLINIKELRISNSWVEENDLQGIDKLVNLENLYLIDCNIGSIECLKRLNLRLLFLSNTDSINEKGKNHISDLSPLKNMKSLTTLFVNYNNVKTLKDLVNLENLEMFTAVGGNIRDASILDDSNFRAHLSESQLNLAQNVITDKFNNTEKNEIIIEIPGIIKQATDENSILYSENGVILENCEWNEYGRSIKISDAKNKESFKVQIISGHANGTTWNGLLGDYVEDYIEINNYSEVSNNGRVYIEVENQKTKVIDLLNAIQTNGTKQVFKDDEIVSDVNGYVSTGMVIRVELTSAIYEYTVVVTGDINGDAEVDELDLLMLARYNAGYEKESQMVVNEYLRASNVHKDEDFGDVLDLLKLARMLVNLD